jgi:transposase
MKVTKAKEKENLRMEKIMLRKQILKLHKKKKSQVEISDLLDVSQSTVSYQIAKYMNSNSFEDLPKCGCPSRLSDKQFNELKQAFLDFPPDRFGGESLGWTTKMAIQYVKDKFNVRYGMRRMQELFHKFGLNLITPRTEHVKSSYAAKVVYRMDFKKNSKTNIWVAPSLISTK